MNIINGMLAIILISVFIVIVYFQLKKIEIKIFNVKNGTLHDKRLSSIIETAQRSSKSKYTLYLPLGYGALFSFVFVIILYFIYNIMGIKDNSFQQYCFMFIWTVIAISAYQSILARKIWTLCH